MVVLIIVFICGCTPEAKTDQYDDSAQVSELESSIVAENSGYSLSWNSDRKYIAYANKETGQIWSSIPQDFLHTNKKFNRFLDAPLNIVCFNPEDQSVTSISGYSYAVSSGRVGSEKIENGIKVTYYFDKYQLSIPVRYVLTEKSLDVSIDPAEIVENQYQIVSISLLPYLCSAKNDTEDSYLFVPAGGGALMECYQAAEEKRLFSGSVYKTDAARYCNEEWYSETALSMPVFGAKSGESALFGIIKSYSGALIEADAGNPDVGFSAVYPTFELRGYDEAAGARKETFYKYIDTFSTEEPILISYYLLEGENAGYEEMAEVYREYLIDEYGMEKSAAQTDMLLTFYGGDLTREFLFGVPYNKLSVLTEYSEVRQIAGEVLDETGLKPSIQLVGFTDNGLSVGKPAGGFQLSHRFGSDKELENLKSWTLENGGLLFADFDIVRFNRSGNGFSTLLSTAKTATHRRMYTKSYTVDIHSVNTLFPEYYLLSRAALNQAAQKLIKSQQNDLLHGVSLGTLGCIAYSDYDNTAYYTKGGIRKQVSGILQEMNKSGLKTMVSGANDYAAAAADGITDVAFGNGGYSVFDHAVPFYQLVFSGYKPMYCQPLNEQNDMQVGMLQAASAGIGLSFSIVSKYDVALSATPGAFASNAVYSANRSRMLDTLKQYQDIVGRLGDAQLVSYRQPAEGITQSVYSNGAVLYTNCTEADAEVEGMTVKAKNFVIKGGTGSEAQKEPRN